MKKIWILLFSLIALVVITNTDIIAQISGQSAAYEKNVEAESDNVEQEEKVSLLDKLMAAVKGFLLPPDEEELETVVVQADDESDKKEKDTTVAKKTNKEKPKRAEAEQPEQVEEPEVETIKVEWQEPEAEPEQEEWQEPEAEPEEAVVEQLIGTTAVSGAYTGAPAHNVQLACDLNNGVIIQPGGVYSAFDYLGDGGEGMGFQAAAGLMSDGTTVDMFGSGICTVTTAIFQAGRDAGLSIVEVSDHVGAESSYAAAGDQAMFNYPTNDLKMRNDFDYPVALYMGYHDGVIYAEWYAQE